MEINLDFVEEILYDLSNHSEDSFVTEIAGREHGVQVSELVYKNIRQGYDIQCYDYNNKINHVINLCDCTYIAIKNAVIIGAICFYDNPELKSKASDINETRGIGRNHSVDTMS